MDAQTFLGIAYAWKANRVFLPANSSGAKIRILHEAVLRVKECLSLLTSFRIPTSKPTKVHEDSESAACSTQLHRIAPRLWQVNIVAC